MNFSRKGLLLAVLQLAIILSLGAKLLYDRATRPGVWASTLNFDPDLPIRGRYLSLRIRVIREGFSYQPPGSPTPVTGGTIANGPISPSAIINSSPPSKVLVPAFGSTSNETVTANSLPSLKTPSWSSSPRLFRCPPRILARNSGSSSLCRQRALRVPFASPSKTLPPSPRSTSTNFKSETKRNLFHPERSEGSLFALSWLPDQTPSALTRQPSPIPTQPL